MRVFFLISFLMVSFLGNAKVISCNEIPAVTVDQDKEVVEDLLLNIQVKIKKAFVQGLLTESINPMAVLSCKLEKFNKIKKQNLVLYWRSYMQFYRSIFYLKQNKRNLAEDEVDMGISWLKEMKNKNSEDYALLSMLQGYSLQFKGFRVMFLSKNVKKSANLAISLDESNLRAYYVYASNDFYTPKKYGGGKETEKFLLKALSMKDQANLNNYLPSWGREDAYEMLIKFYIASEKWDLAKKYCKEAISKFPKSYVISILSTELVDK